MEAEPVVTVTPVGPTQEERIWGLAAHLGPLVLGLLAPLVVLLAKGQEPGFVRDNAVEALNFQLSLMLAALACIPLVFVIIGVPLMMVVAIGGLVLAIVGGVRAYDGERYRYPLNVRLIR
ncbi:MAG: DUF4870 domain-containing protein [Myxococcaceae bacterium]